MRTRTCPKCGSTMIGTWEPATDRMRFRCGCSYTCTERVDADATALQSLRTWQNEITAILAHAPRCPVPADEISIEDVPALLAEALGLVNDAADYKPLIGADGASS